MTPFITRAYNNLSLDSKTGTITKTSSKRKLADEIHYYRTVERRLSARVGVYFPRCISDHSLDSPYFLEMEYLPFENLGNLLMAEEYDEAVWSNVVESLKGALEKFSTVISPEDTQLSSSNRYKMFVEKTEKEYKSLKDNNPFFQNFASYQNVIINGLSYLNFDWIWPRIVADVENLCTNEPFSMVHGDMCFSNILCGIDKHKNIILKFVDPRGSFGLHEGVFGDPAYDYAKLLHSVNGKYELIICDKFAVKSSDDSVCFEFPKELEEKFNKVRKLLRNKIVSPNNPLKVGVLEGLIYIGMCARHYDSLDRQKVMYCTGIKILNEYLEIKNGT